MPPAGTALMPFYGQDYIKNDPRIIAAEQKAEFISHLMEGNSALTRNDMQSAVKSFRRAIKINPGYYLPYTRLGFAFFRMEAYPEAVAALKKSLELNPEQFDILYMLGTCLERMGLKREAEDAYQQAKRKSAAGGGERMRIDSGGEETTAAGYKPKPPMSRRKKARPVSVVSTLAMTLRLMLTRPRLLLPFITYYITTSLLTPVLNKLLMGDFNNFLSFVKLNVNDKTQVLYVMSIMGLHMLVGIPLLTSTVVSVRNIYRGRITVFKSTLGQSYGRLPALVSTVLMSGALLMGVYFVVLAVGSFLLSSAAMNDKQLVLKGAAILATALFAPFFLFTFQYILIEKKSFEEALSQSFRLGGKYYFKALLLMAVSGLPLLTVMKGAFSSDLVSFMLYRLPEIPILCFGIVNMTVFYSEARGMTMKEARKRRSDRRGKDDEDADDEGGRGGALGADDALRESLRSMLED